MASKVSHKVPSDLDGERLDKALAVLLGVSRSVARSLVDDGVVTVDGAPGKANTRVSVGEELVSSPAPTPEELRPEPVPFGVLYEDESVIVVDKPTGLVVHPGAGRVEGSLAAGLIHRFPDLVGVGSSDRWGLVHRLDKDTSGALVVGRTDESFESLSLAMKSREINREYVALAHGVMKPPTGTIDAPIGRDPAAPTRRTVIRDGKHARTHYRVEQNYEDGDVALLRVTLETGRTHQIRVHLQAISHPVIGDHAYNHIPSRVKSPRIFLHAASVRFDHPVNGESLTVESPLPDDLQKVLDSL